MKNFKIESLVLSSIEYSFKEPNKNEIEIFLNDKANIIEINEKNAKLLLERELRFGSKEGCGVKVSYNISVESNEIFEKSDLSKAIKEDAIELSIVYSKISLLISEITNSCPFGVIVTPPNYDSKKIEIK